MASFEFGAIIHSTKGIPEFAREAEDLGYDYLACGEHMFFHGPMNNTLIALSVAAGATQTIKLMSAVVLLPLYPPVLLAKMGSILDIASGGRFHFGVGIGGEFPKEFEACGVPVNERGVRANESLKIIKKLWTERDVSFSGKFTKLSGVTLDPAPIQKPHPPIWVAGRKEPAMRRAVRYADGWMPYMYTPEQYSESIATINRIAKERGRDLSGFRTALFVFVSVYADRNKAREIAIQSVSKNYAQDFSKIIDRYAVFGNPDDCRKRLQEYADAGVRTFVFPWACRKPDIPENLRLLAREVIPAFR